ncbi:hypothetical protein WA026_022601 [Henosepilachna vigintioctopunctata]|uniref:Uncharacterized protein n=1 Tax=Henosepilachna vigintioctopunctata TaxID=420089 RepID=A0AAW1UYD5_9CUCU
MSFLVVSGFAPEVTCEAVLNYSKECGLNDYVACERMKTKKEKYQIFFNLAVPLNVEEKYFDADLWPTGIIVNYFQNIQCRKQVKQRTLMNINNKQIYVC